MNYDSKIREITCTVIFYFVTMTNSLMDSDINSDENSQLEVRAVIVKCQIEHPKISLEEEITRFQREELFKHNALRNCKQKLAVTVKTTSVPNKVFGDEYIPIEHVLGSNKKKNRLLNPYVLRLRRKLPFQSYKLHRIETVTGIIWPFDTKRSTFNESFKKHNVPRRKVNVQDWSTKIDTISAFDYGKGIDIINPKLLEFSSKTKPIYLDDYGIFDSTSEGYFRVYHYSLRLCNN